MVYNNHDSLTVTTTRKRSSLEFDSSFDCATLSVLQSIHILRTTLTSHLSWHVDAIAARAMKKLYTLSSAWKGGSYDVKVLTFIRAVLVHASAGWKPYTVRNIAKRLVETREDTTL